MTYDDHTEDGFEPEFRTTDMILVSVLKISGHEYIDKEITDSNGCCWVFDENEAVMDVVKNYGRHQQMVNPKEFLRMYNLIKQEMFNFLNANKR